ncbi:hypothetical protein GWI33_010860, partial [Rhynchophorus ferrugineus]
GKVIRKRNSESSPPTHRHPDHVDRVSAADKLSNDDAVLFRGFSRGLDKHRLHANYTLLKIDLSSAHHKDVGLFLIADR